MRHLLWTVFLVVAIQGMAAASTAHASPTAEKATLEPIPVPQSASTRLEASSLRIQPSSRSESERKSDRTQPEVLSKNFANPKPVQIYWFFGGR
jgi:hypothetical protein